MAGAASGAADPAVMTTASIQPFIIIDLIGGCPLPLWCCAVAGAPTLERRRRTMTALSMAPPRPAEQLHPELVDRPRLKPRFCRRPSFAVAITVTSRNQRKSCDLHRAGCSSPNARQA